VIHRVGSVHTSAHRLDVAVALAAMLSSVVAGALIVANPMLAFAPIALLGGALPLTDGRARTLFVVFGGMLVLQRPGTLDMSKLAFLAACAVAFAGALANLRNLRDTRGISPIRPSTRRPDRCWPDPLRSWRSPGSRSVAYSRTTPLTEWLRDIAPYVLFASNPIFALDA
jgi:hypothetical protein